MTEKNNFFHLMKAPGYTPNTKNNYVVIEETGEPVLIEGVRLTVRTPSGKTFNNCLMHVFFNKKTCSQEIYLDLIQFSAEQLENHLFSFEH